MDCKSYQKVYWVKITDCSFKSLDAGKDGRLSQEPWTEIIGNEISNRTYKSAVSHISSSFIYQGAQVFKFAWLEVGDYVLSNGWGKRDLTRQRGIIFSPRSRRDLLC